MKKSVLIVLALVLALCVAGGAMADSLAYVYRRSVIVRTMVDGEQVAVRSQSFPVARGSVFYTVNWNTSGGYRYPKNAVYGSRNAISLDLGLGVQTMTNSNIKVNRNSLLNTVHVSTVPFSVSGRCYSEGREINGNISFTGSMNYTFVVPEMHRTYTRQKLK